MSTAQKALSALGKKLDGTKAATTTYARKRAVFFNALQYAVDAGDITENPPTKIRTKRRTSVLEQRPRSCVQEPSASSVTSSTYVAVRHV